MTSISTVVITLLLTNTVLAANQLTFPTTEAEIVQALSTTNTLQRKGLSKGLADIRADKVAALIHFYFDSATIKQQSYPLLREYARALKGGLAGATLEIAGHTDSDGSEEYNLRLSKRRAEAVKNFLVLSYGIEAHRLTIKYYGETKPIETNATEAGRTKNRRVEFSRIR